MPTLVTPPVPHLPEAILELCCDQAVKDLTALGRVLAALRSEAAPSSRLAELISAAALDGVESQDLLADEEAEEARAKADAQEQIDNVLRTLNHDRAFSAFGKHDPFTEIPTLGVTRRRRKLNKRAISKPDVPLPGDISFLPLPLEQIEAIRINHRYEPMFIPGDYLRLEELRQKRHALKERPSDAARASYEPEWVAENRTLLTRYSDQQLLNGVMSRHELMTPITTVCRESRVSAGGRLFAPAAQKIDCQAKSVSALARRLGDEVLAASVVGKIDSHFYEAPFQILQAYKRWEVEKRMIAEKHNRAPYEARSVNDILWDRMKFSH